MSIIEKKKVAVVDYSDYWNSLDDIEALMGYLNSISEWSINDNVRNKVSELLIRAYTSLKEGHIENRTETTVTPKNIAKNIADKIPIEIKWKGKEA